MHTKKQQFKGALKRRRLWLSPEWVGAILCLHGLWACSQHASVQPTGPGLSDPVKAPAIVSGATPPDGTPSPAASDSPSPLSDSAPPSNSPPPPPVVVSGPTLSGCRILPDESPWNTDVSNYPLSPRSDDYIAAMGANTHLHPDFGTTWNGAPNGFPILLVSGDQERLPVSFQYAGQSDPGPYPIPLDAPIQGGADSGGDRHVIVVDTQNCTLYELFNAYPQAGSWWAGSGAIWHLSQNERRPDLWTSADAAGLPILPGLVRYDEVMEKQEIRHALRLTTAWAQMAFIHPATHSDGQAGSDASHPPMGTRVRLRASYDISGFEAPIQVILQALKKYGALVADTGGDWHVGGVPDPRWSDAMLLKGLGSLQGSDFEVVDTGPVHPD